MRKSVAIVLLASLSLVACSPKKEVTKVEGNIAESFVKDTLSNVLEDETNEEDNTLDKKEEAKVKCDNSGTLISVNGLEINIINFVNDTSETKFLDFLAENGETLTPSGGLDEIVKGYYDINKEQEETDNVLHEYLRPPYIYMSDDKYSLQLKSEEGSILVLHNDTENGEPEAFYRTGLYDGATIGSKQFTDIDLSEDTENKLKSMFPEVVENSIGYDCYLGDLENDGYRVHLNIQGKDSTDGGISYMEYTVTYKNMANELDEAIKNK